MTDWGGPAVIAAMLAVTGGYIDATGFLGLKGLFLAHATGNLATLCAALVLGSHAVIGKILALPEFVGVIALTRFTGAQLAARKRPVPHILLAAEVALLIAFAALALVFGPFADPDSPWALTTAFTGISAMAVQNAMQRVHLPGEPPTSFMTGNATDAAIGAVDLITGVDPESTAPNGARLAALIRNIMCFAGGCAVAALAYWTAGFWCLITPIVLVAATALTPVRRASVTASRT